MEPSFKDLYEQILDYEGDRIYDDVLVKWIDANPSIHSVLNKIAQLEPLEITNQLSDVQSWEMYALSRVLDILTLKFQLNRNADGSDWLGPNLELSEYINFVEKLGLQVVVNTDSIYIPFYHEILEAIEGENSIGISEIIFPPVMLNNLLIKRGGVIASCNRHQYDLSIINNSTLYWAYRRKTRRYADLSQGWGSNSQWRTNFRFDYDYDNFYFYNTTGTLDLNVTTKEVLDHLAENSLELGEAIEITINRHFLSSPKESNDLFPYDYRYIERKGRDFS